MSNSSLFVHSSYFGCHPLDLKRLHPWPQGLIQVTYMSLKSGRTESFCHFGIFKGSPAYNFSCLTTWTNLVTGCIRIPITKSPTSGLDLQQVLSECLLNQELMDHGIHSMCILRTKPFIILYKEPMSGPNCVECDWEHTVFCAFFPALFVSSEYSHRS